MIDKSEHLPLVYQTVNFLSKTIAQEYPLGTLIPTQEQLAKQLGVSRITVRNAIDILKQQGVLESCRGKGTVVCSLPEAPLRRSAELFDFPMIQPTDIYPARCGFISTLCNTVPGNPFLTTNKHLLINRRYFKESSGNIPLAWEDCLWNGSFLDNMEEFQPKPTVSLYTQLEDTWNLEIDNCKESIEPRFATDVYCNFFKIPSVSPLLCIKRHSFVKNTLFEYRETLIRHEDFGFFVYKANK